MRELTLPADNIILYIIYSSLHIPARGGGNIYIYIYISFYICREGQLTHLFFPGRVGRGYGPEWTLAVVVSPCPSVLARAGTLDRTLFEYFDSSWKTGCCIDMIYAGNFGPRLFR